MKSRLAYMAPDFKRCTRDRVERYQTLAVALLVSFIRPKSAIYIAAGRAVDRRVRIPESGHN